MKVAFVVESFTPDAQLSGGVRVAVRKLAEFLSRRHEIVVIAPHKVLPPFPRYSSMRQAQGRWNRFRSIEGGVKVYRPLVFHLPVLGTFLEPVQFAFWVTAICALHERGTVLIHAHRCFPAGSGAALAAGVLRLPLLLSTHGSDVNAGLDRRKVGTWVNLATKFSLRRAKNVIAVSAALADRIRSVGVPDGRIRVIYNGVDTSQILSMDGAEAKAGLGLPAEARVVLFAANLVPIKDPLTMLEAFAVLRRDVGSALLVVLGTGELRGAMDKRAGELGVGGATMFVGKRPHDEMARWLAASDVVALSSLGEGCPVIALEAFAAGRPFVGTSVGGAPEVVPESAGILVEPGNPEALANALKLALERKWDPEKLTAHGQDFSWEAIGTRTEEVYELCVAEQR